MNLVASSSFVTGSVERLGRASEHPVEQQDRRHRERDVEHPLQEDGKLAMAHLLQKHARRKGHAKHDQYHPDGGAVQRLLLLHRLASVEADEVDGHATPEDFQVAHRLVDGRDILHEDAPHDHHDRQPSVDGVPDDEAQIGWREEVEHHRGGDIPEGQFVVDPEVPVDGDVADEVYG